MSQSSNIEQATRTVNMVGQIGCVTGFAAILIVGAAFGLGRLLDSYFELETGWFTLGLMLGSFPITLYAITKISLMTVIRAQKAQEAAEADKKKQAEESQDQS